MDARSLRKWLVLAVCAVVVAGLSAGCGGDAKAGSGSTGSAAEKGGKAATPTFTEDKAASLTKAAGEKGGVTFGSASDEGTAAILAVSGSFPAGTKVTYTPLADSGDTVYAPGFRITAEGGAQPAGQVFVMFQVPGEAPADGVITAYSEGADAPVKLATSRDTSGGVTTVWAETSHFTWFRYEQEQKEWEQEQQRKSRMKSWTAMVNDSFPMPDESGIWDSKWTINMHAANSDGNILGPYYGEAKLALKGTADIMGVKGKMSGSWSGPVHFPKSMKVFANSLQEKPKPGEPDPQMGMTVLCTGEFTMKDATPWKVTMAGNGISGGGDAPVEKGGTYPIDMMISDHGLVVVFGGSTAEFDGQMVGVLP